MISVWFSGIARTPRPDAPPLSSARSRLCAVTETEESAAPPDSNLSSAVLRVNSTSSLSLSNSSTAWLEPYFNACTVMVTVPSGVVSLTSLKVNFSVASSYSMRSGPANSTRRIS